jgi:hypothetical protein
MFEPIKIESESIEVGKTNFLDIEKESFIDPSIELKPQPIALSLGETLYKGNYYPTPIGSYGDFSCIVGASKSRKTFVKSLLVAGYLGGNSSNFSKIQGHQNADKIVLEFDTEQSHFHTQRVTRRVIEMVGVNDSRYKTYSLRQYDPKTRFEFIDYMLYESEFRNNIGLVSIDGFVDLVTDFNSLEQSTQLTEKLLQWTSKVNCHITGILHKNFGTSKPVGHVGSSVLKKAETVMFIEKENELTKVVCEYSRNIPFDEFYFEVDENWLPKVTNFTPKEILTKTTKPFG